MFIINLCVCVYLKKGDRGRLTVLLFINCNTILDDP